MGLTWADIWVLRCIFETILYKCLQKIEGLLGHMWSSDVLQKHYLFVELYSVNVLYSLPVVDSIFDLCTKKFDNSSLRWLGGMQSTTQNNFSQMRKQKLKPLATIANWKKHRAIYRKIYLHISFIKKKSLIIFTLVDYNILRIMFHSIKNL